MKHHQINRSLVFVFITLVLSFGIHSISSADNLIVRIFVEKSEYIQGENVNFQIQVAQNGIGIPNAQVCVELLGSDMETLWGACALTDSEGYMAETLEYGWAIPNGFNGYLLLTATGEFNGQNAYSEMPIPYGVDNWDDDDEEEAELDLEIITYDAVEFSQGNNITVGMTVSDNGYPVEGAEICPVVTDDFGSTLFNRCLYTNSNGVAEFQLLYGQHIQTGYVGNIYVWANVAANGGYAENSITIPYNAVQIPLLDLQLFGPSQPIHQGGWEDIGIAGIVTSQGTRIDGAIVTMQVNGQTFQTTTGTFTSGEFNWYWDDTDFPAGNHTVFVTVSKDGYQTATGEIPFTLFGENYDYWVSMDPIQAQFNLGDAANMPGILYLGENPVSNWIQVDIIDPFGQTTTYTYLTSTDGSFTHNQPAMTETGIYQLSVYLYENDALISETYTWTVGSTITPTVEPPGPTTPIPTGCEIVEVQYPNPATAGENVTFTGKVVCYNDEDEQVPQPDWSVYVSISSPDEAPVFATKVKTDQTGTFSTNLLLKTLSHNEVFIVAQNQETGWSQKCYWFGPFKIVVAIEPEIRLSQTDYDSGELLEGELTLNPSFSDSSWDDGLEIIYQIVGPIGGAEHLNLFESPGNYSPRINSFYWQIPQNAEFGDYRITAFISGDHIQAENVEETFWVNDIRHTNLDAFVEPGVYEWSSAILAGEYTDADGAQIPDAEVRVTFKENEAPNREFNLTGRTDQEGRYEIDLEPLDLFSGQEQDDPWQIRYWLTTVYADKEGYATGSAIINVQTPTLGPYLEIIAVNPPLDALSKLTTGGINYTDRLPFDTEITVRYNNIFDGGKLNLVAEGNWALSCVGGDTWFAPGRKGHLSVNGEDLPEWNIGLEPQKHRRSWTLPGNIMPSAYYWYPRLETQMDAKQGFGQIGTVRVSGDLFGFSDGENTNPCNTSIQNPTQPPDWLATGWSGVKVHISLGHSKASVHYRLSPPTLGASGQAWVSPTDGKLSAEIRAGQATGYTLKNQVVQLSIIAKDLDSGAETNSQEITIASNATTDDQGKLELPLTAVTNPCELEKKAQYFVKISASDIEGEQKIPIELRCIEKLEFETEDNRISLVQATDLTDYPPYLIAAGKEAGVRVYYDVLGEIYQPVNKPVQFEVQFEILQTGTPDPVVIQRKRVSLTEEGVSVAWIDPTDAKNQAGIGIVSAWENKPSGEEGQETSYVDFVFTPQQASGKKGPFKIKITFDPQEVYGKKVIAEIDGTVLNMKTLRLIIVPVDIYNLDMNFVLEQMSFLHETYPLGLSNLILDLHPIYETSQIPTTCTSVTLWKEIACGVGRETGVSTNANDPVKVIAIVDSATWLQVNKAFLYAGGISALGTYDDELWDSATNNVVLIRYPENVPNTSAHEIGHAYGLELAEQYKQHPPHGLTVDGLILKNSQILDLTENLGNKNTSSRKNMIKIGLGGVTELYDLMGNAGYHEDPVNNSIQYDSYQQSWIVFKTYNTLLQALKDPDDEDVFYVQGVIDLDGMVHIDPILKTIGIPNESSTEGDYELQLQDSGGSTLYSTRFGYETKPGLFNLQLPYTPGIGRLVVLKDGSVVGELIRSSNAPEITLSPFPEIGYQDTTLNLSWSASDEDSDPLSYSVGYNCDGNDVWIPLAANLTVPTFNVNLMQLQEGTCTLKVTASDGVNSTFALSETFMPPPKGPIVRINASTEAYPVGDPIYISGQAYDLRDGAIPPENYHWYSDRDGDLGIGNPLSATLSEGSHNLTLYVLDSGGNTSVGTASIQVAPEGDENTTTPNERPLDLVKPAILSLIPEDGTIVPSEGTFLMASFADNQGGSGIDLDAVKLFVDGEDLTSIAKVDTATLSLALNTLDDGDHTARLIVADLDGNMTEAECSFKIGQPGLLSQLTQLNPTLLISIGVGLLVLIGLIIGLIFFFTRKSR